MKRLFNCTNHIQSADIIAAVREEGYDLYAPGRRSVVFQPHETSEQIKRVAEETIKTAVASGAEAVIVGGMTSYTWHLINLALDSGLETVEISTEKLRDENDRFVFNYTGLRVIA